MFRDGFILVFGLVVEWFTVPEPWHFFGDHLSDLSLSLSSHRHSYISILFSSRVISSKKKHNTSWREPFHVSPPRFSSFDRFPFVQFTFWCMIPPKKTLLWDFLSPEWVVQVQRWSPRTSILNFFQPDTSRGILFLSGVNKTILFIMREVELEMS